MKVFVNDVDGPRLIGRADVPEDHPSAVYEVPLFGAASIIMEQFALGTVSHNVAGGQLKVDRVILLSPVQAPELLPGWMPLAS